MALWTMLPSSGSIRSVLRASLALWERQASMRITSIGTLSVGSVDSIWTLAIESSTPMESKVSRESRLCLDQEVDETLRVWSSRTLRSKCTAISKAPQVTKKALSSFGVDSERECDRECLNFWEDDDDDDEANNGDDNGDGNESALEALLRLKERELYEFCCGEGTTSNLEFGAQVPSTKETRHSRMASAYLVRSFFSLSISL
mmetsp:Transcript_20664/g.48571  ORF Transcript_20664/g.48571 Transcript_20664/m.48571 type:complete len:203 (-) Transcript_20664:700-1308(-)